MSSQALWTVWAQFLLLWLLLPVPWVEARRSRVSMPCPEVCDVTRCPPLPTCSTGTAPVPDRCGCCRVCAAGEGQECGGTRGRPCISGLRCGAPFSREPAGGAWLGTCGCVEGVEGAEVCGSDGRTYPSLCALRKENRAARLRGSPPAVPVQKGGCGDPGERGAGHTPPPPLMSFPKKVKWILLSLLARSLVGSALLQLQGLNLLWLFLLFLPG